MITVEYLNPQPWIQRIYGDEFGKVYFDLDTDFSARMTKALDRIDETQQISQEAALANSVPATNKNRALLADFAGNVMHRRKKPIDIEVRENGERLPLSGAMVIGYEQTPEGGDFEFEMFADDWIDKLEALQLSTVPLEPFEYTVANVESAWTGDRRRLAMPILGDFGNFIEPGNVTLKDLRFVFNLSLLMKEAFCAIGWQFKSPHFDEGDGEYQYGYLSADDWGSYSTKETQQFVRLDINEDQAMPAFERVPTWVETYDPFNYYNNPASIPTSDDQYLYPPLVDFDGSLSIELSNFSVVIPPPPPGGGALSLFMIVEKNNNGTIEFLAVEQFTGQLSGETRMTINSTVFDPDMTTGDRYAVSFFVTNELGGVEWTIKSGTLIFRPDNGFLEEGNTIPVGELIDDKLTGMDLFNALAHLINGKVITDLSTKTVTLYAPFDYNRISDDQVVPGFYLDDQDPIDLRHLTDPTTFKWEATDVDRERFVEYGFDDSSDSYVDELDEGRLLTRRIDLGSGKADTKEVKNPLFGPTYNRRVEPERSGGQGVLLPVFWDNTDFEISTDVGYRILTFYGTFVQDLGTFNASFVFNGQERHSIPFASQRVPTNLPNGVPGIPLTFNAHERDHYNLFYRAEVTLEDDGIRYTFTVLGGNRTYETIKFRRPLLIKGVESDYIVRPISIKDYDWSSNDPIDLTARPIRC